MSEQNTPKDDSQQFKRGRPGRRSAKERREVVMALLSGRASVDQLARQYGVTSTTIENWRDAAVIAIEQAMNISGGPSARERELERELAETKSALARVSVERALAIEAVEEWKKERPTRPVRSRR